jgi:putative tryptophan/tyrosine transport system substrate-binding protein
MRRREFIGLLGGACIALPCTGWAQGPQQMRRVSLLLGLDENDPEMRGRVKALADQHRVPVISAYRQLVVEGALMSYGPDGADIFRRLSSYVDRILKGESAGNLPAQSPDKFELVVNVKKAKALGLPLRDTFLQICDEVIE